MITHVHPTQCRAFFFFFFCKCGRMFYWWYAVFMYSISNVFYAIVLCHITYNNRVFILVSPRWLHCTSLCCGRFYENFIVEKVFLIASAASFGVRFRRINSWPNWLSSLQNLKFGKLVCFLLVTIASLHPSHFAQKEQVLQLYESLPCRAVWR